VTVVYYCLGKKEKKYKFVSERFFKLTEFEELCDCQMPCTIISYDITTTSTVFPSEFYSQVFNDIFKQDRDDNFR
jgi:hypothetical protein